MIKGRDLCLKGLGQVLLYACTRAANKCCPSPFSLDTKTASVHADTVSDSIWISEISVRVGDVGDDMTDWLPMQIAAQIFKFMHCRFYNHKQRSESQLPLTQDQVSSQIEADMRLSTCLFAKRGFVCLWTQPATTCPSDFALVRIIEPWLWSLG